MFVSRVSPLSVCRFVELFSYSFSHYDAATEKEREQKNAHGFAYLWPHHFSPAKELVCCRVLRSFEENPKRHTRSAQNEVDLEGGGRKKECTWNWPQKIWPPPLKLIFNSWRLWGRSILHFKPSLQVIDSERMETKTNPWPDATSWTVTVPLSMINKYS